MPMCVCECNENGGVSGMLQQTDYTCYLFSLMIRGMSSLSQPIHLEMLLMPHHRRHYNNN